MNEIIKALENKNFEVRTQESRDGNMLLQGKKGNRVLHINILDTVIMRDTRNHQTYGKRIESDVQGIVSKINKMRA